MVATSKSYETKASDLNPKWHVVDAEGETLGRLATRIATILNGMYVPHLLTGDFVIVTNAEKIHVTGRKVEQKMYYRHSGYHGGLTEQTLADVLEKHPDRVIRQAVKGMLPKNSLGRKMLKRLKVYVGPDHPHAAQVSGQTEA
ncbi:MAG: 50S ribosomal protein L13 [Dehalococcoidia bacterium]|nr:50S ribosomal protein L13 [Dehalococcoidia bacterium]